ncbi:hypothetical protein D3C85_15630 [compost metagenome]
MSEEVNDPQVIETGEQWLEQMRQVLDNGDLGAARLMLDSPPEALHELDKVGKTHVIVPNADNVNEDMLDAPRQIMLYTDVMNSHNAGYIREILLLDRHYSKYLPEWFMQMEGHMTKADRLHLIYALTLAGYKHPKPPYTPPQRKFKERQAFTLAIYLEGIPKCLTVSRQYEERWGTVKPELLDIKINRHELPDTWRHVFRKQAVDISLKLENVEGIYLIKQSVIRLGTKAEFKDKVTFTLDDGSVTNKNNETQPS